jgi:hypothetical protein
MSISMNELLSRSFWIFLLLASPAAAQPADQSDQQRRIEGARDHMERGQELYVQSRFLEAAEEFQRAYELQPFGAFLYNAAVAYEQQESWTQAADFFGRYLEREPNARDAGEVRRRVDQLRTRALDAQAQNPDPNAQNPDPNAQNPDPNAQNPDPNAQNPDPNAQNPDPNAQNPDPSRPTEPVQPPEEMKSLLSVRTNPEGAQINVRVGDRIVASGPAPFAQTLDFGDYMVSVEHPDYRTVQERVRIRPGKVYVVIVEMSQGIFYGYLRVVSNVPGAQVFIDDRAQGPMGQTPFAHVIPTGEHRVWVDRAGYESAEQTAEIGLGEDVILNVTLERVTYGRISVVSNVRGAVVFIDDRRMGAVPFNGDVAPGARVVRVEADGMKDWEEEVTVAQGQVTPVRVRMRPSVGRGAAWITMGFGAASLAGGIVLGVLASSLESDLAADRDAGILSNDDSRFTEGLIFSIAADAAFGLATILGIFSLYYFLRDPLPDSEATVLTPRDWALSPSVTPTQAGADFHWWF